MLITEFDLFPPKGHQKSCNKVSSQSPAECLIHTNLNCKYHANDLHIKLNRAKVLLFKFRKCHSSQCHLRSTTNLYPWKELIQKISGPFLFLLNFQRCYLNFTKSYKICKNLQFCVWAHFQGAKVWHTTRKTNHTTST